MTIIISGFPGVGKSTLVEHSQYTILDSDSSTFNKNNFPLNYINHIKDSINDDTHAICVSSHKDVREALQQQEMFFTLVYPSLHLKDEYIQRYTQRGNHPAFIQLLSDNWHDWIIDCQHQEGCRHYTLQSKQYLNGIFQ